MRRSVTLAMRNYDYLAPLASGDIAIDRIALTLERDTPEALTRTLSDPKVHAGELSLSKHIQRVASGERSFVGIPTFPYRAFRHRCFFVRRDSGLRDIPDLEGTRIGTNDWQATGNTWSRAILRDAGVALDRIQWWVGSVDGPPPKRAPTTPPPPVRTAPPGRALRDMLLDCELDALMCPNPPAGFYAPGSKIVRLLSDYPRAEQAYYRRTGIYPLQHIVGVRRDVFERDPWIAASLYEALEQSKQVWQASRRSLADTLPWTLAEVEEATRLMGQDWHPNGIEANRGPLEAFLDEQVAQRLIGRRLSVEELFAEYLEVTKA